MASERHLYVNGPGLLPVVSESLSRQGACTPPGTHLTHPILEIPCLHLPLPHKPFIAPSALTTAGRDTEGCVLEEAQSWAPVSHVARQPVSSVVMPTCAQQPMQAGPRTPQLGTQLPIRADWRASLPGFKTNNRQFGPWPCPLLVLPKLKP